MGDMEFGGFGAYGFVLFLFGRVAATRCNFLYSSWVIFFLFLGPKWILWWE
jgi:hypothetical protein